MDIRLVAYKRDVLPTEGEVNGGSFFTNYGQIEVINLINFPSGDATDYYQQGMRVYTYESELIGVITYVFPTNIRVSGRNAGISVNTGQSLKVQKINTFDLDLQDNPSVSLNFQFTDTQEPEKRKASYSQTFKLPFTDVNNDFFNNWYNLNTENWNYTTRSNDEQLVEAALYVGTTPVFEGVLQLKKVYTKKGLYEVVLLSNSASLVNRMGNKSVQEAFFNAFFPNKWKFEYNYDNIVRSWDGSTDLFVNLDGESFRDTAANVQKVMFPMQVNNPGFIYPQDTGLTVSQTNRYMRMSQTDINIMVAITFGLFSAQEYAVPIHQFKPAIQIREVLKKIIFSNGFTYTSTFIDSTYFGRLFMTTCNHKGQPHAEVVPTPGMVDGQASAGWRFEDGVTTEQIYMQTLGAGTCTASPWVVMLVNDKTPSPDWAEYPNDPNNLWNLGWNGFLRTDDNMTSVFLETSATTFNLKACSGTAAFKYKVEAVDPSNGNVLTQFTTFPPDTNAGSITTSSSGTVNASVQQTCDISNVPIGMLAKVSVRLANIERVNPSFDPTIKWGFVDISYNNLRSVLIVEWTGSFDNVYNKTVDVIGGIDPDLTQKDFVKDMIKRFNLVIVPDREDPTNLLIEPYNTFMASGEIRDWSDKLDLSKEVMVKDTLSLQKATQTWTDSEDDDVKNKSIKEFAPDLNVWGHVTLNNTRNEFASGESKYESIFSPYLNEEVFSTLQGGPTAMPRMLVQYETSYEKEDNVYVDVTSPKTKPKLFYYSGTKTNAFDDPAQEYYLHQFTTQLQTYPGGVIAHAFTEFPLCTPFELTVAGTNEGTIGITTKALQWSTQPPELADSPMFNFSPIIAYQTYGDLYNTYWAKFNNLIYDENTRIVECFLNLNTVDIFQFGFNDEIFIKDQYYQILELKNYQVGAKVSTKAVLMTLRDEFVGTCTDCDYVVATVTVNGTDTNSWGNRYLWCPQTDTDCISQASPPPVTLDLAGGASYIGTQTTKVCCDCQQGLFTEIYPDLPYVENGVTYYPFSQWNPGFGFCMPAANSLPTQLADIYRVRNLIRKPGTKRFINSILGGYGRSLSTGTNRDKFSYNILPEFGDDIKIQYKANSKTLGPLTGESHRLILLGRTTGTTKSYAYINGESLSEPLYIPFNSIVNIRVKGISTVIGGSSSTFPLGSTEAFAYYTAFKNEGDDTHTVTQLGTVNGTSEYDLLESGKSSTCTLEIDSGDDKSIRFGIKDADADAERMWQLTVEYDVNFVPNMERSIDANYALYQDGNTIGYENETYMIWN